jgi:hypothetical protein
MIFSNIIFFYFLLIYVLPFEGIVIFFKLLLLNMQTFFYWVLNVSNLIEYFGIKKSVNLNTTIDINFENNSIDMFIKKIEKPKSNDFFEQYDFINLFEQLIEFIYVYKWFLLPIFLYFVLIYILHCVLGLYSAYVDYFQKNPDHFQSIRAVFPAIFIFYFLIFVFFALIYFFIILYLHYILWFLFYK